MMHGPEKSDPVIVAGKPTKSGAIRSGVGGAKDRDQGECGPTKHAPDSEPDKRVHKVLARKRPRCVVNTRSGSRMQ
jgi:hypothetical protein